MGDFGNSGEKKKTNQFYVAVRLESGRLGITFNHKHHFSEWRFIFGNSLYFRYPDSKIMTYGSN
jgi:hypothetical protein